MRAERSEFGPDGIGAGWRQVLASGAVLLLVPLLSGMVPAEARPAPKDSGQVAVGGTGNAGILAGSAGLSRPRLVGAVQGGAARESRAEQSMVGSEGFGAGPDGIGDDCDAKVTPMGSGQAPIEAGQAAQGSAPGGACAQGQEEPEGVAPRSEPREAGFPYNFYYGNLHSHSAFTDGGLLRDAGICRGSQYCRGEFGPAEAFAYAGARGLQFLAVVDHNHLFDCHASVCQPWFPSGCPWIAEEVRAKYHRGRADAEAATRDGEFIALYGTEFGVVTQPTDGHVTVLDSPVLFNWESNRNPEYPGTGEFYDVFVGRSDYAGLYAAARDWGVLGFLNHPRSTQEYNFFEFTPEAREAIAGLEVVNGPAFCTADDESCIGTRYAGDEVFGADKFQWALGIGFRVAPYASQDNHCQNYGFSTSNRTVALAPALTKADLLAALAARHVYATFGDTRAQLIFSALNHTRIMGDTFTHSGALMFNISVRNASCDIEEIRVYKGVPESRQAPQVICRRFGTAEVTDCELFGTPGNWYVYVYVRQANGAQLWSAPMWITVE